MNIECLFLLSSNYLKISPGYNKSHAHFAHINCVCLYFGNIKLSFNCNTDFALYYLFLEVSYIISTIFLLLRFVYFLHYFNFQKKIVFKLNFT